MIKSPPNKRTFLFLYFSYVNIGYFPLIYFCFIRIYPIEQFVFRNFLINTIFKPCIYDLFIVLNDKWSNKHGMNYENT